MKRRIDSFFKSQGKKTVRRTAPRSSVKTYRPQRITRFIPDKNTRNQDFSKFIWKRFIHFSGYEMEEDVEYYGLQPDEISTETLIDLNQMDLNGKDRDRNAKLQEDLAELRKLPYLKKFTEDQLLHLPLTQVFGIPSGEGLASDEIELERGYHDFENDVVDNDKVEDRVSPEHVPGTVPWQNPIKHAMTRAGRWLTLNEDHLSTHARYIDIPTVKAPQFIEDEEMFTLEPIEPGELIVQILCGVRNVVYLLRSSFDGYLDNFAGHVVKHPLYQRPLAGCKVRQFVQPERPGRSPRARQQSRNPRKTSRPRELSRTPVTIDLTVPDVVDLSSSP